MVQADPHRLGIALTEILANARDHTPPDTPIEIDILDHADTVTLEVTDHGPGIPPRLLPTATDPFVAHTDRPDPGLGLGLTLAHDNIAAHGGVMTLASVPGTGLQVTITLPRRPTTRPSDSPRGPGHGPHRQATWA